MNRNYIILLSIFCFYFQSQVNCFNIEQKIHVKRQAEEGPMAAVNSLKNQRTDVSLTKDVDSPWENFIIPGPVVISLLGQLMVMSGKVDFSLSENAPAGGFKYVRHSNSFRATLVQVSNDGWGAFMNAHKNMDMIQLYMQQVPEQVKTALKVILTAPPKLIKRLLPISLSNIENIGKQCVTLSAETESKFNDVMFLLGEILESTESTHGTYDAKLLQAQVELNASAIQKQHLESIGENLRQRQAQIDQQVQKYQDAYDKALKEIPTGWKAIAQDFVRAAVNLVNIFTGGDGDGGFSGPSGNKSNSGPDFQTSNVLAITQQYYDQVGKIKDGIGKVFSGEIKATQNPGGMFSAFNTVLGSFENMLQNVINVPAAQKAVPLIQKGKQICGRMQNMFKDVKNIVSNISEAEQNEINGDIDGLIENMKPMAAAGAYASDGMSIQGSGASQIHPSTFAGKNGNARFKAYMNMELLRDAQTRSDKIFDDVLKYQEEMKNLMTRMATVNLQAINFKDIIDLIKDGIIILSKIRTEWSKLVQFFSMVSVRAKVALNQTLNHFLQTSEQAQELGEDLDAADREFFKGILQKQAVDINNVAFFLYTLSSTYVDVSNKYLMSRLAGLAQMLATTDEQQRQTLLTQLKTQSDEAQAEIKLLAQQKRMEFKTQIQTRIDDVNTYVQQLGGPSETDKKAAKRGIDAIKKKETDPNGAFDIDMTFLN